MFKAVSLTTVQHLIILHFNEELDNEIHYNSRYLFVLAVETLAIAIRQLNSLINGITIEKEEKRYSNTR